MLHSERKRLYLSLGIEQAEVDIEANSDEFNEGETMSANDIENVGDLKAFTNDAEQLVDFAGATDTATELNVAVEAAIASGKGLSRIEAAALTSALKASVGHYVAVENNLVPACESYEVVPHDGKERTSEVNKEQTSTASKGLKEGIKAFIEAIIKKIKSIIHGAKVFFKKLYDRLSISLKRIKDVNEKLKSSEYFGEYKTKFNTTNIHLEGGYSPDKYAESMTEMFIAFDKICQGGFISGDDQTKFLAEGVEAVKKSDLTMWDKIRVSLRAYLATGFSEVMDKKISKKEDGTVVSETFPGGKRFVFSPGEDTGANQLPSISFERTDKIEGDPTIEISLPNRDVLKGLLQAALSLLAVLSRSKKESTGFEKAYDEVIKKLDAAKALNDAKIERNKNILSSISVFAANNIAFKGKVLWFSFDQISTVCQLAELAFKLHEENKKEHEKEKAA